MAGLQGGPARAAVEAVDGRCHLGSLGLELLAFRLALAVDDPHLEERYRAVEAGVLALGPGPLRRDVLARRSTILANSFGYLHPSGELLAAALPRHLPATRLRLEEARGLPRLEVLAEAVQGWSKMAPHGPAAAAAAARARGAVGDRRVPAPRRRPRRRQLESEPGPDPASAALGV